MDPRYIEAVVQIDDISLGCTQCNNFIFEAATDQPDDKKLTVFDLVRASLRHSCATVERVTEIVSDATSDD